MIADKRKKVRHAVSPSELELCRRLAAEASAVMGDTAVGMGSESGDPFRPFFIVANADEPPAKEITESLIQKRFGGTISPLATVRVEPLVESGDWWEAVQRYGSESPASYFEPWRAMIAWFNSRPEFVATAFVQIGDVALLSRIDDEEFPEGTEMTGCVLPRLALGLTAGGSLAGLFGHKVST